MRGPGIWAAGALGSVVANAAMLGILAASMRPDPVAQQQLPQSELDVQAYQMERSRASEQQPEREPARRADPDSTEMQPGVIEQSRARPAEPDATPVAAQENAAQRFTVMTPVAQKAASLRPEIAAQRTMVETPAAQKVARLQPASAAQPPAKVNATRLAVNAPGAMEVAGVAPEAMPAETPQPETMKLGIVRDVNRVAAPELPADAIGLAPQKPDRTPVPTAENPAERLVAALAFAGGGGGEIDPVSLAAFQSFVRPGDVVAGGDALRDGVAGLLDNVPCSRLQVGFDPDTATLTVNGHVPENGLRAPVLAALQEQMGADIAVSDNILILPRPQCGALSGIASVGLPQSTDQNTNPLLIGEDTHARVLDFVKDDRLFFDITAPDYDAYVYVDYFDAGGNVLHLAPNAQVPLERAAADTALRIGAKTATDTRGLQIFIGPPYGQEIAVAFAASTPLYEGERPLIEPAAPYLEWLKSRVAQAREEHPGFKGEWVYFFVTTSEKEN